MSTYLTYKLVKLAILGVIAFVACFVIRMIETRQPKD